MGRFSLLFMLLAAGGGAYVGYLDLETTGAVIGGVLGLLVGGMLGEVLDLTVGPFMRKRAEHDFSAWFMRVLGLVLIVLFLHEGFWALNITPLVFEHNIGAKVTQLIAKGGDQKKPVQDELKDRRWQPQFVVIRPVRFLQMKEVRDASQSTLELIDGVVGDKIEVDKDLHEKAKDLAEHSEKRVDLFIGRTWLLRFIPRNVLIPKE
jgi:hypothetical protein